MHNRVGKGWSHLISWIPLAFTALLVCSVPALVRAEVAPLGSPQPSFLNADEHQWLAEHPNISIGVDPSWAPFEFVENGQYAGMGAEYMAQVSSLLGIQLTPVPDLTWPQVMDAARQGRIDALSSVVDTPQRREYLTFTRPYLDFPMVVMTRDDASFIGDIQALAGKPIGVVDGYATVDLIEKNYPRLKLVTFPTVEAGLNNLSTGRIDAFVDNLATISYAIKQKGITNIKVAAQTPFSFQLGIGVRKDWPQLVSILDKTLAQITPAQKAQILNRWIAIKFEHGADLPFALKMFLLVAVVILLVGSGFIYKNRALAAEVARRKGVEKALERRNEVLDLIVSMTPLKEILETLIQHVESDNPHMLCSVLLLDQQGKHLVDGVAPRLPDFYNKAIDGVAIGQGVGSCGHAAFTNETVIVEDINTHPNWAPYTELTRSAGLHSCWSAPIRSSEGEVLGTFAIYASQPSTPTAEELKMIAAAAKTASLAIERQRSAERLLKLSQVIEYSPNAVAITNEAGAFEYLNPGFTKITGFSTEEAMGQNLEILQSEQPEGDANPGAFTTLFGGQPWSGEMCLKRKSGRKFWAQLHTVPILDGDGRSTNVVTLIQDFTERKRAERGLKSYADTLKAIMDNTPFGIWLTDKEGHPKFVNDKLCVEMGMDAPQLMDTEYIGDLFDQQVRDEFSAARGRGLDDDRTRTVYTTIAVDGVGNLDFKVSRVTIRDDKGDITGFVGIVEDVTATQKLHKKISHQARHDALTGLMNRTTFEQKLDKVCQHVGPDDTPHALCYFDLDQFKIVNDTCGHHAGDELLRQLTGLYKDQARDTEATLGIDGTHLEPALARLGGDEFGLLLYNCSIEGAMGVAQRLVDVTQAYRFSYEGKQFSVGCSVGVVPIDVHNGGAVEVLKRADGACYVAKEKGRGRTHLSELNDENILNRQGAAQWAPRITEAIENDLFVLYAQNIAPVAEEGDGDRFEVLVRYQAADGEVIPPGAFLPAAERFNMMPMVDRWVIERTFTELEMLYGEGKSRTLASASINLSGQTLGEPWLLEFICQRFDNSTIRPEQICFEITESAAIANLDVAMRFIEQLRDVGCKFSLDDFGSGLSSFSYLHQLKVDYLKIDGSLVKNIATDPVSREMVTAIHKVGRVMGLQTVGEFVEDDATLATLKEIGVDFGQGYGIDVPKPLMSKAASPVQG